MEPRASSSEDNHLEGLRRHVAEAEARVEKQKARLAEIVMDGHIEAAHRTKEILDVLAESLAAERESLRLEEKLAALRPWYS